MRANYMEFPSVLKRVREQLGPALSQRPGTVQQLVQSLGLLQV